eukprot:Pgem_evm1s17344
MLLVWSDQGYGNRKGAVILKLMRRTKLEKSEEMTQKEITAKVYRFAPQELANFDSYIDISDPIVSEAQK